MEKHEGSLQVLQKLNCPSCESKRSGIVPDMEFFRQETDRLQSELLRRDAQFEGLQEKMKAIDADFKETKWVLANQVAEKHDQVSELRQMVSELEELLRQAKSQTQFKDNIIKTLRLENKKLNKDEVDKGGPKLCDIVNEVQQKLVEGMPCEGGDAEHGGESLVPKTMEDKSAQCNVGESTSSYYRATLGSGEQKDIECQTDQPIFPSSGDSEKQQLESDIGDELVSAVDDMLKELSVDVTSAHVGKDSNSLKEHLEVLHHTLLEIYLPNLQAELQAEKVLVANKEETVQNLHAMVGMREEQVTAFRLKVEQLEQQLEQQRQVIAELQQAVQNCRQLEHDTSRKEVYSLKFELCELDGKVKSLQRESKEKDELLFNTLEEKVALKKRLNCASNAFQVLQPELTKWRQLFYKNENFNEHLEKTLQDRQKEISALQAQVEKLEAETEADGERNKERQTHDAKIIRELKKTIESLQAQLCTVTAEYKQLQSQAQLSYMTEKMTVAEQRQKLEMQHRELQHAVQQLACQKEALNRAKMVLEERENCTRKLLEQGKSQQESFTKKLQELQLEYQKKVDEGQKNLKKIKAENDDMRSSLIERDGELRKWEDGELSVLSELEGSLHLLNKKLKHVETVNASLTAALKRETAIRRSLEHEMETHRKIFEKLQLKWKEKDQLYQEAQNSELDVRREMQIIKDESFKRLQIEIDAKCEAQRQLDLLRKEHSIISQVKVDYEELHKRHLKILDALETSERAKSNLKKMLDESDKERRSMEKGRDDMEEQLESLRKDNVMLIERINCIDRKRGRQRCDHHSLDEKYKRMTKCLEAAEKKIIHYETKLIPNLEIEVENRESLVEMLKIEVADANSSCKRMREEAKALIDMTGGQGDSTSDVQQERRSIGPTPWSPRVPSFHTVWGSNPPAARTIWSPRKSPDHYESGFHSLVSSPSPLLE